MPRREGTPLHVVRGEGGKILRGVISFDNSQRREGPARKTTGPVDAVRLASEVARIRSLRGKSPKSAPIKR